MHKTASLRLSNNGSIIHVLMVKQKKRRLKWIDFFCNEINSPLNISYKFFKINC